MKKALCAALLALVLAGCATLSGGAGNIDSLHLFGLPVTLNLDGVPGPDGFAIRVYATQGGAAKGVMVHHGLLEILMFDGVVSEEQILAATPAQTWKFNPRELNQDTEKTSLGQSYRFALRWDAAPKHNHITVVARHTSPNSQPIYSSPSTIAAAVK